MTVVRITKEKGNIMADTDITHLTFPSGVDQNDLKSDPAIDRAKAYREAQLTPNPSKELLARAGIVESETVTESQVAVKPSSTIIFTNNAADLPPGASGRIISPGVFEIVATKETEVASPVIEQPPAQSIEAGSPPNERPLRAETVPTVTTRKS